MTSFFYALILMLGIVSFVIQMMHTLGDEKKIDMTKRILWVVLSFNLFLSVLLGGGSVSAMLLAGILMFGNMSLFLVHLPKGEWGITEQQKNYFLILTPVTFLLVFFNVPLFAFIICLFLYYKLDVAEYKEHPVAVSRIFLFAASVLSIVSANTLSLVAIVFPMYLMLSYWPMTLHALQKSGIRIPRFNLKPQQRVSVLFK